MIHYEHFEKPTLRVVVLCPCLGVGGAERWLATLMRNTVSIRWTAVVAAARMKDELTPEFPSVPVFYADQGDRAEAIRRALSRGADLILTWGFGDLGPAREYGVPIVHVSHSSGEERPNDWQHALFRLNASQTQAHHLAAVSESATKLFTPEIQRATPITVIHNGSDLERVAVRYGRDWQRAQWGLTAGNRVLLYVGRFSREKNPQEVVEAAGRLPEGWAVVMYGWGEMAESLRAQAKAQPTPNPILFPKPRAGGLGDVYAAADVVCIPSYTEAFPLVMIEAWHAHRPVVCSDFSTVAEIENKYAAGGTMALRAPAPLAAQMIAALAQMAVAEQSDRIVERACSVARREFTGSAMAARWEAYLLRCVLDWHTSALNGRTWNARGTDGWYDAPARS